MIKVFGHYFHRRTVLQVVCEAVLIGLVSAISMWLQRGPQVSTSDVLAEAFFIGGVVALVFAGVNSALGLYEYSRSFAKGVMRTRAVLAWGVSCCVAFVFVVLLQLDEGYNLVATFAMLALTMSLVMIWRELSVETLPHAVTVQRVLIYGAGQRARAVAESLQHSDPNVQVVGFFASPNESEIAVPEVQRVVPGRSLTDVVRDHDVDEIVVALTERRGGSMPMRELLDCKLQGVRVMDIARHFEQKLGQIRLDAMSAGYLIFGEGFNQGFFRTLIKRAFDIIGALVLVVLSLPLMLITAILIRIDSPGPILYRQERVGLHGRIFHVVKFRSMRTDAEKDGVPQWATAGDSRVTRVGRVIRKVRIDELPQLFSVLKGDMSLVGLRPERQYFVDQLTRDIPFYAVRHSVKPGVTGWAQVRYHYAGSLSDTTEKLQYDLYYVKNHSLFLDLVILFETVGVVLTGKGAQ